ncbi:MAG TPA: RHS repeat-associated core domain-containing protein [Polyangiales bacterium]|nr:RHS repeat-associated core domain-containing protein [Polyangiales bacterium]
MGRLHQVLDENDALIHQYDYDQNGARVGEISGASSIALGTNLGCGPMLDTPVDAQDRLCRYGDYNYTYDANGQLSSKTQISTGAQTGYMYDGLGRLRAVLLPNGTRIDYVLDALGRRIGKIVGGTLVRGWLYGGDSLRPMAQLDSTGQIQATFVYGTHVNVPDSMVLRSGAVYRLLTDHLGSVRFVVDAANGGILQRLDYDEFGNVLTDTNPGFQPFGFAGGLYDADTGLVRFGARDYDALTGRWTAKDPILFASGDTNLYAYVGGDPVNRRDPRGLDWVDVSTGFGDGLTFGLTRRIRNATGWGAEAVDPCSSDYSAGKWVGIGLQTAALWASLPARAVAWGGLSLRQKALYELGSAALSDAQFASMALRGTEMWDVLYRGAVLAEEAGGIANGLLRSTDIGKSVQLLQTGFTPAVSFAGRALATGLNAYEGTQ